MKVVVVGAGLAGLTAARGLLAEGHQVRVLEAAPVVGGRLSTGSLAGEPVELGAAEFSVRSPSFHALLAPLVEAGVVAARPGRIHRWANGRLVAPPLTSTARVWSAPEGMARLMAQLAQGLDVHLDSAVTALSVVGGRWRVVAGTLEETADTLVMALPAPEALHLALTARDAFAPSVLVELGRVVFEPALVVGASYPRQQPGWTTVESEEGAVLRLHASHSADHTRVVIHAASEWSGQRLDQDDQSILSALLAEAGRMAGDWLADPTTARVVRWRHAWPSLLAPARCLLSEAAAPAVFCGDWCVGPRVEGAFLSGQLAAERLALLG